MRPIDWRELYAANRSVVERSRSGAPGASVLARERMANVMPTRRTEVAAGGGGTWERFSHSGPGGSRPYFLYTPPGLDAAVATPLVVMLHGCTQTAADLARSTTMNEVADRHGFVVVYPQQSGRHNPQSCWNWFLPAHQGRGSGEPAVIAGIAGEVTASSSGQPIDHDRVFLAGMSAGGAMAAVLGSTYPELFAGMAVHSGLPFAAATSQEAAFGAMARGAGSSGRASVIGAMGERARVIPTFVIHGTADPVVSPVNGDRLVEQWLEANGLATRDSFQDKLSRPTTAVPGQVHDGHAYTRYCWRNRSGRIILEYLKVAGLGHAWSGGAQGVAWTDDRGPDASTAIWEFFAEAVRD